jgi:hypothetical protein
MNYRRDSLEDIFMNAMAGKTQARGTTNGSL